jgi:hypothetical protein
MPFTIHCIKQNENTPVLQVTDYRAGAWAPEASKDQARHYCSELERGEILYFPRMPFTLNANDIEFLISRSYSGSRLHKNVSYRPGKNQIRGFAGAREDEMRVRRILQSYSSESTKFLSSFLTPYSGKVDLDFASFRALEEEGRDLPLRKRNDLLHVDAFPTRPSLGSRILRIFTNVNPVKNRVWATGARFRDLAERYAANAGLDEIACGRKSAQVLRLIRSFGIALPVRSPYDEFMLRFHDFLKENSEVQNGKHDRIEFPPLSTWMVYTDAVSHAALSGQFAMEQTFFVPLHALVSPDDAPIRVLEQLCRRPLAA